MEEFGESLQLLANYYFNFSFFNLAITQNVFPAFTEDINSQLLNFKLQKTAICFQMSADKQQVIPADL